MQIKECVDTFVLNAKFLGLLRTMAGAERLLPIEYLLEGLRTSRQTQYPPDLGNAASAETPIPIEPVLLLTDSPAAPLGQPATTTTTDWAKICFYITPIGEPESEQRKHADLFLGSIVEPAIEELGLQVVRADHIGKPGMITAQVIEHVVKSDTIPFDLDQFRTIQVDTTDSYSLVPRLETYRAKIANQARRLLEGGDTADNPLTVFYPGLAVSVPA